MSTIYRTTDGDMVDLIAHRHYGPKPGAVEAIYEANPGLAEFDVPLVAGINITLPELPKATEPETVRLWD
ncbi:MAG: tail protein X [Gammaproteobacteria bacterium]|nr:tail protein X [Gammaproteobacteria bacterium]